METTEQSGHVEHPEVEANHCHWHPAVETRTSCSRCGKAMCPQCMVQAPVGLRCRECGKASPMPTYDVRPVYYLRAVGAAAGAAVGGGVLWWIVNLALLYILQGRVSALMLSLVAVGIGYGAGEVISLSVNRKRGTVLAWIAGASVVVAYLISLRLTGPFFDLFGLIFVVAGVLLAVQRVRR